MTSLETIIIILLIVYALIVTYLLYDQYRNHDSYLKDKVDYINNKQLDLSARERILVGRETCDKELMRLKTVLQSALSVLNSYNPASA